MLLRNISIQWLTEMDGILDKKRINVKREYFNGIGAFSFLWLVFYRIKHNIFSVETQIYYTKRNHFEKYSKRSDIEMTIVYYSSFRMLSLTNTSIRWGSVLSSSIRESQLPNACERRTEGKDTRDRERESLHQRHSFLDQCRPNRKTSWTNTNTSMIRATELENLSGSIP